MSNESATLPEKLSALPERWIDKIFGRMEAMYGSLFLERWKGTDLIEVKRVWCESLASFSDNPECFTAALKALLDEHQWPPTLPEFVALCRKHYRRPSEAVAMLEAPQPLSREEAKARLAEAMRRMRGGAA
jgi:hypothetical protein